MILTVIIQAPSGPARIETMEEGGVLSLTDEKGIARIVRLTHLKGDYLILDFSNLVTVEVVK